ncbi:low molecular weight protein-tyrosine-phosphatase [Sedimenticola thiotaurini]|uniref:protein-tyrosine-phosphatase n=1 Tax=Sedimenticola thiotaurini TaxID=1543721 RepID=A0A0F7JT45_9GAMM|nr:low molecular weight protein-tyrosine-phosphatase [Sedimenticola thiotaurini]AKH19606.1 phosphotyrosine protein phosphatase [Sedimenticola thiotaurini]
MKKISVLFVCMGNICRSPTAHGVFEKLVEDTGLSQYIEVDSAGTHAYHVGNPPDPRAQKTALSRGVDLSQQRARQAEHSDFERFDYVIAMDQDNLNNLLAIAPENHREKLHLLLDFAPELEKREVPDPYFGGTRGFDKVFDLVSDASQALLTAIRRKHQL